MKNKILVTGHKGFLGSYLYQYLKKKYKSILGKDINLYSKRRNYKNNFLGISINDLKKTHTIIHLAGISTNYDPNEDIYKKLSFKANYQDTLSLAKLAKSNGVKKFIFASSTSVYGNKNNRVVTEQSKLSPTTSYGKSKKKIEEKLIKIANRDFKVIILRMVTLFGVSKRMRFDLLVNNLIISYLLHNKIILSSDGIKIRPQIDLKDATLVYEYFLNNDIKKNHIILNVGRNDYNLTVGQIARKIAKIFKCKVEYGKKDLDKRSYNVSFKKLNKYISFEKSKNTIEKNAKFIKLNFGKKRKSLISSKYNYNLDTVKHLIKSKEINQLFK